MAGTSLQRQRVKPCALSSSTLKSIGSSAEKITSILSEKDRIPSIVSQCHYSSACCTYSLTEKNPPMTLLLSLEMRPLITSLVHYYGTLTDRTSTWKMHLHSLYSGQYRAARGLRPSKSSVLRRSCILAPPTLSSSVQPEMKRVHDGTQLWSRSLPARS